MSWEMAAQGGKVTLSLPLEGVEPLIPASRSWDGQCLTAKESSFGLQGWF